MVGIIICGLLIIVGVILFKKKSKGHRREYSLGLKVAEDIQSLVKAKNYKNAEQVSQNQDINDITQIVDHLALSLDEEQLNEWCESTNSDLSKLTLGVFYLHLAWISRSHKLAKNVSQKDADSFYEYLELSETTFDTLSENSAYLPELNSRKIRLYMSFGNDEMATKSFEVVSRSNPDFIWPYIHYSEFIQPKWGSDIKDLHAFYESLPDDFLIQSIVELKLVHDSRVMDDNYFKKHNNSIDDFANKSISKIDKQHDAAIPSSIHRYILYNYMESLAQDLGNSGLRKKYLKLIGDKRTIYPYGLLS